MAQRSFDELLAAAWTYCAPQRNKEIPFPTGFWPDVARVAIEMERQGTLEPVLDFTPTRCVFGKQEPKLKRKVDLSQLEL